MSLTKVTYSMIDGATVNALDYGADPTGTTNSATAIQTAINTGNPVYLPAGTYLVNTTLTNTGNLILFGSGSISVAGNDPQTDKSGACIVWNGADGQAVFDIYPDNATSVYLSGIKIYVPKTFTYRMVNVRPSLVTNEQHRADVQIQNLGLYRTPLDYTAGFAPGDSTAVGLFFDLTTANANTYAHIGYNIQNMYLFNLNIGIRVDVANSPTGSNFFNSNFFDNIYMYQVYRGVVLLSGLTNAEIVDNLFDGIKIQPGLDSSSNPAFGVFTLDGHVISNTFVGCKVWDIPDNNKLTIDNRPAGDANGDYVNRFVSFQTTVKPGAWIDDDLRPITRVKQYWNLDVDGATAIGATPTGVTFQNGITASKSVGITTGGVAGQGLKVSATANFGVFFGSGAPTIAAAKGSLYLRSDGSTTNDRMYVNTNGSTTWTAVITAT